MTSNMKIKVIKSLNCKIHVARLLQVNVDNKSYLFLHCEYLVKNKPFWFVSSRLVSICKTSDSFLIKTLNNRYRVKTEKLMIYKLSVNQFIQLKYK